MYVQRESLEATFIPGRASVSRELVLKRPAEVIRVRPYRGARRMAEKPAQRPRKRWDPTDTPMWVWVLLRASPVLLMALAVLVLWGANR